MYDMLNMKNLKVGKEDLESFKESIGAIKRLNQVIENVENAQEDNRGKFKKDLDEMIPKLTDELN